MKRPNFLEGREPKDVFIDGWKPDLSDVKNDFIRAILEKIFVLNPEKRLTARELHEILSPCDVSADELGAQYMVLQHKCSSLETALNDASARIAILEGDTKTKSGKIVALKEGLEAKTDELSTLEEVLAAKSDQIDALEAQCKEQSTAMKTLESRIALLTINNPQSGILLLPRLMRAAHTNSSETVRVLVEGGDDVGKRDEQGRTALMHAALQGHVEPARLLVEKEKGLQDRNGWTALMHAVHNNHPGVVEILAAHECGKRDSSGNTALMIAAERGRTEAVRVLVEHERGARDSRNRTALMTAAQRGGLEMVKVLAEHEKGITDEDGRTALVHAARAGHRETVKLLMEHEKDVTGWTMLMCAAVLGDTDMVSQYINERGQKDKRGQTALIIAAQNRRDEAVKLLIKHEGGVSGWTSLIYAAYLGDVDVARDNLHERGRKDDVGRTALMWAAQQEHEKIVKILLEHEKGMKDITGRTALMLATEGENKELIEMLIPCESGLQDNSGRTALMHATVHCHTHTVELLLKHEMKIQDNEGRTALMWAIQRNRNEMIKILLEHEKGVKDKQGHNALYYVLRSGRLKDICFLIETDDPTDENGVTALMRAAARGDAKLAELLVPIQKEMRDKDGNTAFVHALKSKHADVAMILLEHEAPSRTPLMCAAVTGDVETAKRHLNEMDERNSDGDTAYTLAARAGHEDIVELLDPTTSQGVTALMRAAERGDVDTVKAFTSLQTGRKAEYSEINGWKMYEGTALMRAAAHGHTEIVRLLVEYEGRIQDADGQTALMMAAYHGHLECTKLLLYKEKGMRDNKAGTALMYATKRNHLKLVELLADQEAGMQDKYGYTALMIAVQNSNTDCVKVLAKKESHIKRTYSSSYSTCTETALDLAKKCNHEDKRDELIEILFAEPHDK
ncbi:hypothetical protein QR46_2215 [Giardia duodenalis assemblage B]|uniref:Uncharacterized protein n=1 Tax=Giardia duodenalis assemblage B TaxID=1394984 RepID=A0A132NUM6_GIAIN|nr:hypothetical protein QR46_2215 [Giardia intestinalis assemblage B]